MQVIFWSTPTCGHTMTDFVLLFCFFFCFFYILNLDTLSKLTRNRKYDVLVSKVQPKYDFIYDVMALSHLLNSSLFANDKG